MPPRSRSPSSSRQQRWTQAEETALRSAVTASGAPVVWGHVAAGLASEGYVQRPADAVRQHWAVMLRRSDETAPTAAAAPAPAPAPTARPIRGGAWSALRDAVVVALLAVAAALAAGLADGWMVNRPAMPPAAARQPVRPPPFTPPDDDDEILCDCAWTRWPGQSCDETRGRSGFPCWRDCCATAK
jgi:hypothetical protein